MKKIISLFALLWIATSCIPSEKSIQESTVKTHTSTLTVTVAAAPIPSPSVTPSVIPTATPKPTITQTIEAIPACLVDIAGVMDYFRLHGYSKFSEEKTQSKQSIYVLNELDSEGYGRMLSVLYNVSCVYQINAIIKFHLPPTDAEINKKAYFMATVTGAGLTSQQNVVLGKWFTSPTYHKLLDQAYKNGKATSSVHLSPPSDNPFAEMTYEYFSEKFIYTYVIVF